MIEWILILIVGGLLLWVIEWIIRYAWCYLKWCVLGWKPDIYDADLVEYVCEECAQKTLNDQLEEMKARDLELPSDSEIERVRKELKASCRSIIDGYCMQFKWSGKPKKASVKIS